MGSRNAERRPKASCSFEYPPSESELPQGSGYSGVVFGIMFLFFGTAQADSGEQDMTLQGNRRTKCESFMADGTVAGARARARAPLSVFLLGHLTASFEIGERPFPFSGLRRGVEGNESAT